MMIVRRDVVRAAVEAEMQRGTGGEEAVRVVAERLGVAEEAVHEVKASLWRDGVVRAISSLLQYECAEGCALEMLVSLRRSAQIVREEARSRATAPGGAQ